MTQIRKLDTQPNVWFNFRYIDIYINISNIKKLSILKKKKKKKK